MVSANRTIFGIYRRALHDWQQITLDAFARNIRSVQRLAPGYLVNFVDEYDARLFGPLHCFAGHIVHIDQPGAFLLRKNFQCLRDFDLPMVGLFWHYLAEQILHVEADIFHSLRRENLYHWYCLRADFDVYLAIVEMSAP